MSALLAFATHDRGGTLEIDEPRPANTLVEIKSNASIDPLCPRCKQTLTASAAGLCFMLTFVWAMYTPVVS